jgi:hypothetical protein
MAMQRITTNNPVFLPTNDIEGATKLPAGQKIL